MSDNESFTQCWYDVVPPSATLAQHHTNIGPASDVCWVNMKPEFFEEDVHLQDISRPHPADPRH